MLRQQGLAMHGSQQWEALPPISLFYPTRQAEPGATRSKALPWIEERVREREHGTEGGKNVGLR